MLGTRAGSAWSWEFIPGVLAGSLEVRHDPKNGICGGWVVPCTRQGPSGGKESREPEVPPTLTLLGLTPGDFRLAGLGLDPAFPVSCHIQVAGLGSIQPSPPSVGTEIPPEDPPAAFPGINTALLG